MNESILRMALVINTSHDSFAKNVANIVLYFLYNNGSPVQRSIKDLKEIIKNNSYIEFTEYEIESALNNCLAKHYVTCINNKYSLDELGYEKIAQNSDDDIKRIIGKFLVEYQLKSVNHEDIFQLICSYLYELLNNNIIGLLHLLDNKLIEKYKVQNENGQYTNEQRKIINDFLEWDNKEKNEILFRLIAFSVDYCRLTTKKDKNSFVSLLKGKKFYLDANIIYRLMGINNKSRQESTQEFIKKCTEAGIKLIYTNVTYKELVDSFKYYVDDMKAVLQLINASPLRLKKLYENKDDNDFYDIYYEWAGKNKTYNQWNEFLQYLMDKLRKTLEPFAKVTIQNYNITDKDIFGTYVEDLEVFKLNGKRKVNVNRTNVEYDVNNILHIFYERNRSGKTAWEINDYMVSADQALAAWTERVYPGEVPFVVLPSIWYSILLKLMGRTEDDYKAYVEFMRLRYNHTADLSPEKIIYEITRITKDGEIQDRIIDILSEGNCTSLKIAEDENYEINKEIRNAYDKAVSEIRVSEYDDGYSKGKHEGFQAAKEEAEKTFLEKGKRLAELDIKRKLIMDEIEKKTSRRLWMNRIFFGIIVIVFFAISVRVCLWIWFEVSEEKTSRLGVIIPIISALLNVIITWVINKFVNFDYNKIKQKLMEKYKGELSLIENESKELLV